jgi:putative Mg2+ transporter-C (MgtC) family protein
VRILIEVPAWVYHLLDLTVAYVLALPIGWERERGGPECRYPHVPAGRRRELCLRPSNGKSAGGSCRSQPRIIEGVITGMGSIGGGAILKTGETVRATATAASLWATGAIGVSCAVETYDVAVIASAVTLITAASARAVY